MSKFTERQQNICIYGGLAGAGLAATSLIQHLTIAGSHWIAYTLTGIYLYTLAVFILLSLQKWIAPLLLIIATSFMLVSLCVVLISGLYSLVLILLFLYCTVMTVVIYMEGVPARLKEKAILEKNEDMEWRGKI